MFVSLSGRFAACLVCVGAGRFDELAIACAADLDCDLCGRVVRELHEDLIQAGHLVVHMNVCAACRGRTAAALGIAA